MSWARSLSFTGFNFARSMARGERLEIARNLRQLRKRNHGQKIPRQQGVQFRRPNVRRLGGRAFGARFNWLKSERVLVFVVGNAGDGPQRDKISCRARRMTPT
jgi:hypothetical protein